MLHSTAVVLFALVFTPASDHYDLSHTAPSAANGYYQTLEQCNKRAAYMRWRHGILTRNAEEFDTGKRWRCEERKKD